MATGRGLCFLIVSVASFSHLGPGSDPWPYVKPSEVGLDQELLTRAGDVVGSIGTQFCLSVVKDGALVLDRS
jgi:hypothetical protein